MKTSLFHFMHRTHDSDGMGAPASEADIKNFLKPASDMGMNVNTFKRYTRLLKEDARVADCVNWWAEEPGVRRRAKKAMMMLADADILSIAANENTFKEHTLYVAIALVAGTLTYSVISKATNASPGVSNLNNGGEVPTNMDFFFLDAVGVQFGSGADPFAADWFAAVPGALQGAEFSFQYYQRVIFQDHPVQPMLQTTGDWTQQTANTLILRNPVWMKPNTPLTSTLNFNPAVVIPADTNFRLLLGGCAFLKMT